jgi:hypothetical protein
MERQRHTQQSGETPKEGRLLLIDVAASWLATNNFVVSGSDDDEGVVQRRSRSHPGLNLNHGEFALSHRSLVP